jgi:hypothetical protein
VILLIEVAVCGFMVYLLKTTCDIFLERGINIKFWVKVEEQTTNVVIDIRETLHLPCCKM